MSEKINQIPENVEIYRVAGQQPAPAETVTVSFESIKTPSNSTKVDKLDVQSDEQLKQELQNLLEDNQITEEICAENIENFEQLSLREKITAVKNFINPQSQSETASQNSGSEVQETAQNAKSDKFDKSEYNKKSLNEKIEQVKYELAKNIYINGAGGIKGSDGEPIQAHGVEAWNNLTDEEKQAFVNQVMTFISQHKDLQEAFSKIQNGAQSNDENAKYMAGAVVDHLMNTIQTANIAENDSKSGISVIDFLKKSDEEKTSEIYGYVSTSELNENDKEYIKKQDTIKAEILKIKNANSTKQSTGLEFEEALEYAKYNNININEVLYNAYKEIPENKRTQGQKLLVEKYEEFMSSKNGKSINLLEKAANYDKLKTEYEQLKNKPENERTQTEKNHLAMLEQYLQSKDAKDLEQYRKDIPKPQGEYETQILKDGEELKEVLSKAQCSNSKIEALASIEFIESKIQGKSDEEKAKYIATFIKFNPSAAASIIYGHYAKKLPELSNYNLAVFESGETDSMSAQQFKKHSNHVVELSKGNKLERAVAQETLENTGRNIQKCKGAEFDEHKSVFVETASNDFEYANKENATRGLNTAFDVTTTITDEDSQYKASETVIKSKHMNEKTAVHITDNGYKLLANNQANVVNTVTNKYAEAVKHLAEEKDLISKYDKIAQTLIFKGTHNALGKYFDGDELVKYSKALADQISSCDKNNQLDMHKEIMTSSSSEVRTYAASNIRNYDTSVQADAIDATVATGDTNAIATAYSNTNPVVQEQSGISKTIEMAVVNDYSELTQKIQIGTALTREEYESLTDSQKREYRAAYFLSLPPAKQVEIITKIADMNTKKLVFKKIAENNPALLKSIIGNDASTAEFVYNMHIADNMVLTVAKNKGGNNIQFANLAKKIEKNDTKSVNDDKNTTAQNPKIKTVTNYMDSPFNALRDKKNNNIYIG